MEWHHHLPSTICNAFAICIWNLLILRMKTHSTFRCTDSQRQVLNQNRITWDFHFDQSNRLVLQFEFRIPFYRYGNCTYLIYATGFTHTYTHHLSVFVFDIGAKHILSTFLKISVSIESNATINERCTIQLFTLKV